MTTPHTQVQIAIRDLETIEDLRQIGPIEKEVWGLDDRDVAPMTLLIASKEAGSVFLGAFDAGSMVGFAFGFPSFENGHIGLHSHMLAVLPQYRDFNLGYRLKLAQRERALQKGMREMSWTFDPLQSRNAHFNFAKLGVVSNSYKVDFYGHDSSSVLHQNGTDRLWLTWVLDSRRVQQRIAGQPMASAPDGPVLVQEDAGGGVRRLELSDAAQQSTAFVEIPADIVELEHRDPKLAGEWRSATRWAFTELMKAGFFVQDFIRAKSGPGRYWLSRGDMRDFVNS